MKLVIATPLYPPEPGGPATYAKLLEEGIRAYGDEVHVVKFSAVRELPRFVRHFTYCRQVIAAGRTADLIVALDPVSVGLPVLVAARILGKPYVVKIVGDFAWEQGTQRFGVQESLDDFVRKERVPFAVACMRFVQSLVARGAARIIVPSEYLKHIVAAWGIDTEKISVIYNAIELPAQLPEPLDACTALAKPYIVTVARLVPWKGIDQLVHALADVQRKFPGTCLAVVGDGPLRAELEQEAAESVPGKVWFSGAVSHEEALAVMRAGDVFVLNSAYEGLSHVLIEALMLGKPIVTTNVGGNPELIRDEENGLLVSPGEYEQLVQALERVLSDEALRARLAARARASATRFSTQSMVEKTRELLVHIL